MAGSSCAPTLEESSGLEDILEGMRTMDVAFDEDVDPMVSWGRHVMNLRQEINEHPVKYGIRLKHIIDSIHRLYEQTYPDCFPNQWFENKFKILEKMCYEGYRKNLRNDELKAFLNGKEPEDMVDAIVLVGNEHDRLNEEYQFRAETLWINTDNKCEYCTDYEYHLYDCLLPKTDSI